MSPRYALLFLVHCAVPPFRTDALGGDTVTLQDDEESALVTIAEPQPCATYALKSAATFGGLALLSSDRQITVAVEPPGTPLTVLRKLKRSAGTRRIDLNLVVTSATGFDQGALANNAAFARIRLRANDILSAADIRIGEVRYFYVDAPHDIAYFECTAAATLVPNAARNVLAQVSLPLGINVLLTRAIDAVSNTTAPLYAVGGFSPIPGRPDEAIVLTLAHFDADADWGRSLAHELGHFLGLQHVVESNGTSFDTLADTPRTGADAAANLMYWSPTGNALTPEQIARMRAHPLAY